jgi:hypothetical protein
LFSDQIELYIPPKKGRSHVLRIIRELIEFQPQSKKNRFRTSLEVLSSAKKRKGLFYNLDFMSAGYEHSLENSSKKKHDITGIRVYDIREQSMPNLGMVPCSMLRQEHANSRTVQNRKRTKTPDNFLVTVVGGESVKQSQI